MIGDVSGHLETLREELRRLGANADGRLPDDLVVVQVGDLVHRGPDSDQIVELVDDYLSDQPDNWIQLMGNHEALYLGTTTFRWPQRLSPRSARTVRRWFYTGAMIGAVAIHGTDESFLVTHAGLTGRFWHDVLGGPADVGAAADRLATLATHKPAVYARPGHLLGGNRLNLGPAHSGQPPAVSCCRAGEASSCPSARCMVTAAPSTGPATISALVPPLTIRC